MIAKLAKYWYIIVIAISLAGNAFFIFDSDNSYIKEYENKINNLESEVTDLKSKNVGLKGEIVLLEEESDSLDTVVDDLEQKRKDIIRSYEIYLQQITDLDDSELERWFLTRYNDRTGVSTSTVRY